MFFFFLAVFLFCLAFGSLFSFLFIICLCVTYWHNICICHLRLVQIFILKFCFQCSAEEGSPLGLLLKKTVATVMADFQSVLALDGLISQVR